jgi:hypothetical protein
VQYDDDEKKLFFQGQFPNFAVCPRKIRSFLRSFVSIDFCDRPLLLLPTLDPQHQSCGPYAELRQSFEGGAEFSKVMSEAMEMRQLEQAAKEVNESLSAFKANRISLTSLELSLWKFHKATKGLNRKASAFITDAKKEYGTILEDAKKEAEYILAVAVEVVQDAEKEAESIAAQSEVIVQDAEKKAEAILAVAVEEAKKLKAKKKAFVQGAKNEAAAILSGAAEEKQKWEAEKNALAGVQQFEPIVNLNVGGVRVMTSLANLRRFPDTMIGCMFSGRHTMHKGEDGYFFIDRDGTHFHHILNFLRSPETYKIEVEGTEERELRRECNFYCLEELIFPPSAVKTFRYYDLSGKSQPWVIHVEVDFKGLHTIRGGGKIEYCPHCHRGFFNIGAGRFHIPRFHIHSPAAQPKVRGACPSCRGRS